MFRRFSKDRKSLVTPVTLPDQDFVLQWQSVSYEGKLFDYSATKYFTAKGERVRSKSEVIIADILNRLHIPYRYEFPLELKGRSFPVYPEYASKAVVKNPFAARKRNQRRKKIDFYI